MLPVSEVVGDEEAVFAAFLHELQSFGPSGDDAVEREGGGFAALYAAVEEGAVDEHAFVVAFHLVGGFRASSVALSDDLVLQSALGGDDAFFLGIVGEVAFALFLGCLEAFCSCCALFLFLFCEEVLHELLCLAVAYLWLSSCDDVLDGCGEVVDIQFLCAHVAELASYSEA